MNLARVWPIVLQFGIGAILCWIGIRCGWKSGFLDLKLAQDRRLLFVLVAGYLILLAFSCVFTFWLPFIPKEAVQ